MTLTTYDRRQLGAIRSRLRDALIHLDALAAIDRDRETDLRCYAARGELVEAERLVALMRRRAQRRQLLEDGYR